MYITSILIFLILYFIFIRTHLKLAVMFIIVALPSYLIRFSFFGVPFTILEAMILIAFFSWFVFDTNFKNFIKGEYKFKDYLENKKNRTPYPFRFEISFVLIISFMAVAVAGFSNEAFGIWKAYFFEAILFFVLVLNVFKKDIRSIIYSLAVSAFGVSVFAIVQKFTGIFIENDLWRAEETRRVVSFFGYPNAVGLFLAPIIMILIGYLFFLFCHSREIKKTEEFRSFASAQDDKKREFLKFDNIVKGFLIITIITSIVAIYFAKSEGALVALLFAFVVFGLFLNKWTRTITASLMIIGIGVVLLTPSLKDYTVSKASLMDFSGQVRRAQWAETWQMLKDGRIIQGSGLSNYKKEIEPYHIEGIFYNDGTDPDFHRHTVFNEEYRKKAWRPTEIYLYPHNIFLNFWTELGLLGMLLFTWIIIKFFIISFSNFKFQISNFPKTKANTVILGLTCSMLVIIVHGLVDVPYFKNDLSVLFWLIIAIASIIYLKNKKALD